MRPAWLLVGFASCQVAPDAPCVPVELHPDRDLDGFGDPDEAETGCGDRDGWVTSGGDCDDLNGAVSPAASEVCNGRDDDCDGQPDDGLVSTWYLDRDADGAGDPLSAIETCQPPIAAVEVAGDCDDLAPWTGPFASERCDGQDNDCDAEVDEGVADAPLWYADADFDGHGADGIPGVAACVAPPGRVAAAGDCDDADPTVFPGAPELCNGEDDDCDARVDDADLDTVPVDVGTWYVDEDEDTFGDDGLPVLACEPPPGTVERGGDCDDLLDTRNPDAPEVCGDGDDQDCNTHDPLCHPPLVGDVSGLVLTGDGNGDAAGAAVTGLGDVDGDGFADLAIGGPGHDGDAGGVWLVRGPVDTDGVLADPVVGLGASHRFGASVAAAGDLDGDGLQDLIAGAPLYGPAVATATGAAFVMTGPVAVPDLGLASARLDGVTIGDEAGTAVSGPGDLDGDGLPDVAVGAPGDDRPGLVDTGYVAVVLGPVSSGSLLLADALYLGEAAGGRAGQSLAPAGDTDGDGVRELWIGAPSANGVWRVTFAGGFVFLSDVPDRVVGEAVGDTLGTSLAGGEDLDGDGYDDLVVGAPAANGDAGRVYVVPGPVVGEISAAGAVGIVEGVSAGDRAGTSVAVQGGEVLVGVPGAGGAALFRSEWAGVLTVGDAEAWLVAGPEGGSAVSGAGDFDDDRALDWVIGSPSGPGSATVVFGD